MAELADTLAAELATFEKNKDDLLQHHEGKFVVIKGDQILGAYDTKLDAVAVGHQHAGADAFLVKKVERVERPVRIFLPRG